MGLSACVLDLILHLVGVLIDQENPLHTIQSPFTTNCVLRFKKLWKSRGAERAMKKWLHSTTVAHMVQVVVGSTTSKIHISHANVQCTAFVSVNSITPSRV
jgi:hypothetical protein